MSVPARTEEFVFRLFLIDPASGKLMDSQAVKAAYFKDEERFTFFKTMQHETVFAVRTDLVHSIERLTDLVHSIDRLPAHE